MRNFKEETEKRVAFIKRVLEDSGAKGIIFGNSGGKDSALVGILCKIACENTVGLSMPCYAKQNYGRDMEDGNALAQMFSIENRIVDLTKARESILNKTEKVCSCTEIAISNIAPRLRMICLYLIGQSENRLVAGTGNASERYMGYFTKWGDGGYDFNPIADLKVSEIRPYLEYLGAPQSIIYKEPTAGLFDGQTDEKDMGVSYAAIDKYMETGQGFEEDIKIIRRYHSGSQHKREMPLVYKDELKGEYDGNQ